MTDEYADLSRLPLDVAAAYRAGVMRCLALVDYPRDRVGSQWDAGFDCGLEDAATSIAADLAARERGGRAAAGETTP